MARRAGVAIIVTLCMVALYGAGRQMPGVFFQPPPNPRPTPVGIVIPPPSSLPTSSEPFTQSLTDANPDVPVDLYGNGVSDALASYALDPTGVLYEEHSPNTELPRLGSPTS